MKLQFVLKDQPQIQHLLEVLLWSYRLILDIFINAYQHSCVAQTTEALKNGPENGSSNFSIE